MNWFKCVREFQIELEFEVLVFEERGKPEYPEKSLFEQGREPTTNSTHIWRRRRELNPGYTGGRRALLPLRHPCSPNDMTVVFAKKHVFWISPSKTQTSFTQIQTIPHDFLRTCEYFHFRWTLRLLLLFPFSFH